MRTLFLHILPAFVALLSVLPVPAQRNDSLTVIARAAVRRSPALALGRQKIDVHSAGAFLFSGLPSYTDLEARFDMRSEQKAFLLQEGDGCFQGVFHVRSIHRLNRRSAVRAGADYSRGVKKNVLWNSTSDFRLLYPAVMADTVGGNLQQEQYSFFGAYVRRGAHFFYGLQGSYRALHEFRQVDPRPRNIVSDLHAMFTIGRPLRKQVLCVNGAIRIYKQSQGVTFFNPLGANTSELHFTGLGSRFARFDGAGDFTSSRYLGHGFEGTLLLIPAGPRGWTAVLSGNTFRAKNHLDLQNEVPITELRVHKLEALAGCRCLDGLIRWNVLANVSYEVRRNLEYIIGAGKNDEFPILGSLPMYRSRAVSAGLSGALEFPSRAGVFSVCPAFSYDHSAASYRFPQRKMEFDLLQTGIRSGLLRDTGKWLLDCGIRLGCTAALPTGVLSIPPEHTDARILEMLEYSYGRFTSFRTVYGVDVCVRRHIGKNTSVYWRTACTHRSFKAGGGELVLVTAVGLGL